MRPKALPEWFKALCVASRPCCLSNVTGSLHIPIVIKQIWRKRLKKLWEIMDVIRLQDGSRRLARPTCCASAKRSLANDLQNNRCHVVGTRHVRYPTGKAMIEGPTAGTSQGITRTSTVRPSSAALRNGVMSIPDNAFTRDRDRRCKARWRSNPDRSRSTRDGNSLSGSTPCCICPGWAVIGFCQPGGAMAGTPLVAYPPGAGSILHPSGPRFLPPGSRTS